MSDGYGYDENGFVLPPGSYDISYEDLQRRRWDRVRPRKGIPQPDQPQRFDGYSGPPRYHSMRASSVHNMYTRSIIDSGTAERMPTQAQLDKITKLAREVHFDIVPIPEPYTRLEASNVIDALLRILKTTKKETPKMGNTRQELELAREGFIREMARVEGELRKYEAFPNEDELSDSIKFDIYRKVPKAVTPQLFTTTGISANQLMAYDRDDNEFDVEPATEDKAYTYLALRAGGFWYLTGTTKRKKFTWDELVQFMVAGRTKEIQSLGSVITWPIGVQDSDDVQDAEVVK